MKHNRFFLPTRPRTTLGLIALGLTLLLALGISIPAAHAQTYSEQPVYSFSYKDSNGVSPFGSLINIDGILYGTTNYRGVGGKGTVFSLNPQTQVLTTLYSFTGGADGGEPMAGLTEVSGVLYGTTVAGGVNGEGTVFSINPDGTGFQTLYSFLGGANDGAAPQAALLNVNGILYGTTGGGGHEDIYGNGEGTVFSIDPQTKVETNLHSFTENFTDGGSPSDALILVNGTLYGTTFSGGTTFAGTIFSINPDGSGYQTRYNFVGNSADGQAPAAGLLNVDGILYGTTLGGGSSHNGTIFSFDPVSDQETTRYSFTGSNGDNPFGNLIDVNGVLYGTTSHDSINYSGNVFSFDPATSTETTVHAFTHAVGEGAAPRAGLLNVNGILYGTASAGGAIGSGAIFSLTPAAQTPIAANDTYTPRYNTAYAVKAPGVLANDRTGGSPLTATLVLAPQYGTLVFHSDGSFIYTPYPGLSIPDFFLYTASNSLYSSNIAMVTLNIQLTAPVAHDDAYAPTYNRAYTVKAFGVQANDYPGANETPLTTLVTGTAHGSLTLNQNGSFTYIPNTGFAGTDSFTYQDSNGYGVSNTATVTLTVAPILPNAANDTYAPRYATAYAVKAPGVLANDGAGGDPPTAVLVSNAAHGTLTFHSDGSFLYTPSAGFVGTDSFTYQDTTAVGTSNTATVTLHVQASAPIAGNDAYSVKHNTFFAVKAPGVLANDYAGDSGSFTAALVTSTTNGTLTFSADGSFTYSPNAGFSGTDTFTYTASNSVGTSNIATVTLTVQ